LISSEKISRKDAKSAKKKIKENFADLAALREKFGFCNELALCFGKENL
jgi:hypothetical protein